MGWSFGQNVWLLLCLALGCVARPSNDELRSAKQCGYDSCHKTKPNMLNVHIVSHTHDDVGWLKTLDQYYYGSKTSIQQAGVQYIIDSVVDELIKDPTKKFIYVESAFFFKWWAEQTLEVQKQVKQLVNEGRLEFIGGAWSMNDEATTHYQSIIDQFAWGLRQLSDTFGECGRPRIGWQIDPFGHSREMASIFAQMGFDGMFIGRLDYQDWNERMSTKTPEMIWKASTNLGKSSELFTGALYHIYNPPPGFCFDITCTDEPIIDGEYSLDNNVERRISEFIVEVETIAKAYRTNNILLTMGEDFHYQDANSWYKNLDKLIKYTNAKQSNGSNINVLYSTPSCYLKSLHEAGITWPTKTDDFFPYASDPNAFWTGYFISRPTLKRYERVGNQFAQICKQLTALSPKQKDTFIPNLDYLREMMGVMQHHDAITGTEKEHVASDYTRQLHDAISGCNINTNDILNQLINKKANRKSPENENDLKLEFKTCSLLNISSCEVSENSERFILTLYNPLAKSVSQNVRFPIQGSRYEVMDFNNSLVESQIVPVPEPVQKIRYRNTNASKELVFLATNLPPMGFKSYYITVIDKHRDSPSPDESTTKEDKSIIEIGNHKISLRFNINGTLSSMSSNGVTRLVNQEFGYYEGTIGDNKEYKNRSSGAYILRPKTDNAHQISNITNVKVVKGPIVDEVHQIFNDWISQVIRIYHNENFAEFEWMVGPIPINDGIGKEVITRFRTGIVSNGTFFTDSNGREMLKRKLNHRDTWNLTLQEHIAGNYYPLTTKIALEGSDTRMAVLIDRAQGGSSFTDGTLEIMVHRRLLHDDAKGVGEALNETEYGNGLIARGHHYLFMGPPTKLQSPTLHAQERIVQLEKLLPAWMFFSNASEYSHKVWYQNSTTIFSGISQSLPENVHLLTYEPWHKNELLIRFEHIMEKDEDPQLSKPATLKLKEIFANLKISKIRETTLDGNKWLDETQRLQFTEDKNATFGNSEPSKVIPEIKRGFVNKAVDNFVIDIKPMQIRTFVITLKK